MQVRARMPPDFSAPVTWTAMLSCGGGQAPWFAHQPIAFAHQAAISSRSAPRRALGVSAVGAPHQRHRAYLEKRLPLVRLLGSIDDL